MNSTHYTVISVHAMTRNQLDGTKGIQMVRLFMYSFECFAIQKNRFNNRPGVAGDVLQTALSLIISLIHSLTHLVWFEKISLRRCNTPTVGNGALSHKIE